MQEVFEKILEKLEENQTIVFNIGGGKTIQSIDFERAIEIVKQEAEKFGTDINVGSNGWIPCSERLPKVEDLHEKRLDNCTCYLIQRRCGIMDVAHYIKVYGEQYFEANSIKIKDVIAWQPLPQPYQPNGE